VGQGAVGRGFISQRRQLTVPTSRPANNRTAARASGGTGPLRNARRPIETAGRLGRRPARRLCRRAGYHDRIDACGSSTPTPPTPAATAYNGTLTNGALIDTTAGTNKVAPAKVSLDGANDYVNLSAHQASFSSLSQGTISAWIKTTQATDATISN